MSSDGDLAISVRRLSKAYSIVHEPRQSTLAETMLQRLHKPFRRPSREILWALRDVGFDVKRGDVVGIIGRNGAGKTTLLKILSCITEPTVGEVELRGQVGSLLEVGTGFHPDLTGRENIFLNGAILGMRRAEIRGQFDAIVDFAGIEQFLDTPVKRYSSGMYVRLAFAVAAHLRSEILIVDEVLAVGDADFQHKCLGKMRDVATAGRTVLMVTHQIENVTRLCGAAILLERGQIVLFDRALEVVTEYSKRCSALSNGQDSSYRGGTGAVRLEVQMPGGDRFLPQAPKTIRITSVVHRSPDRPYFVSGLVRDESRTVVLQFDSRLQNQWFDFRESVSVDVTFRTPWLKPGTYRVDVYACVVGAILDEFPAAAKFTVESVLPYPSAADSGAVRYAPSLADFDVHRIA